MRWLEKRIRSRAALLTWLSLLVGVLTTFPAASRDGIEDKDYGVFEAAQLRCTIGNNQALGTHRQLYNGIYSMVSPHCAESPFVPAYAGFNLEHFFDLGPCPEDRALVFEPRHQPMQFRRIDSRTAELHQEELPHFGVESTTRFTLVDPYYVDITFTCTARRTDLAGGVLGVFWASYIHAPLNKSIYFLAEGATLDSPRWLQFCTQHHNHYSTVIHEDGSNIPFVPEPQMLWNQTSPLRYSAPFFYGRFPNMVLIYVFEPDPRLRFAHSPSGGGATPDGTDSNPAWDVQWVIPGYEANKEYRLQARLVYKPWEGRSDVLHEVRKFLDEMDGAN